MTRQRPTEQWIRGPWGGCSSPGPCKLLPRVWGTTQPASPHHFPIPARHGSATSAIHPGSWLPQRMLWGWEHGVHPIPPLLLQLFLSPPMPSALPKPFHQSPGVGSSGGLGVQPQCPAVERVLRGALKQALKWGPVHPRSREVLLCPGGVAVPRDPAGSCTILLLPASGSSAVLGRPPCPMVLVRGPCRGLPASSSQVRAGPARTPAALGSLPRFLTDPKACPNPPAGTRWGR